MVKDWVEKHNRKISEVTENLENCTNLDLMLFSQAISDAYKTGTHLQFFDTFLRAIRRRKIINEAIMIAKGVRDEMG